jgi:hypothetical protein
VIFTQDVIDHLPDVFHFHRPEHEELTHTLLQHAAAQIDFTLKIQKASIQLLAPAPFAVLGFRRSHAHIFVEFLHESEIEHARIIKTITSAKHAPLHRVNVATATDIDPELLAWIVHASTLVA